MSNLLKATTAVHQDSHDFHRAIRDDYTRLLSGGYNYDSIEIRPPIDSHSTAIRQLCRPFYVTAYLFWAAAFRAKYIYIYIGMNELG